MLNHNEKTLLLLFFVSQLESETQKGQRPLNEMRTLCHQLVTEGNS